MADSLAEIRKLVGGGVASNERGPCGARKSEITVVCPRKKPERVGRAIPVNMVCHKSMADWAGDKKSALTGRKCRHLTIRGGFYRVGVVVRVLREM